MSSQAWSLLSRVRRAALAGLLALASHALLPYVHALTSGCGGGTGCSSESSTPSHSADCAVCGALAHAGARAVDAPSALALGPAPRAHDAAAFVPPALAASVSLDAACARAPPAPPRSV